MSKIEKNFIVYEDGTKLHINFNDGDKKVLECGTIVPSDTPTKTGPNGGSILQDQQDISSQVDDALRSNIERYNNKLKDTAKSMLEKYSLVVQRAYEAGVPFPDDWKEYGNTLRFIAKGAHPGPIPSRPEKYPDEQ